MGFITAPPEITSALIHSGPGAEALLEASTAWQRLSGGLEESAGLYSSVVNALHAEWSGPSSEAMIQAVEPYLNWMLSTAQQCYQMGSAAAAAASSFSTTLATVVPPSVVSANRAQLARLLATNGFGRNSAAIAENEAQYAQIWENNTSAMFRYQAASAQAVPQTSFSTPPPIANATAASTQSTATANAAASSAGTSATSNTADALSDIESALGGFDPQAGWFGLANQYANQFISSGFPINLLSYAAQNTQAQAFQGLGNIGHGLSQGLSEGEDALGAAAGDLAGAARSLGASAPTAAMGTAVTVGKLSMPPAVVGLLPSTQPAIQLASAASPLPSGLTGFESMLPPLMPPPISAGSGWRKRKQPKYEDITLGQEIKGTIMPRNPSAG